MAEDAHVKQNERSSPRTQEQRTAISDILKKCNDWQLLQLTKFYRDRLEQAIEKEVDGISSSLTYENHFNWQEYQMIIGLTVKGNRADSSKLLLNLAMEKSSGARRLMWESFVKMRFGVSKLDKILKEIEAIGFDGFENVNLTYTVSEVPMQLKDVQQKHKETLRVQTETLRVNTILIKEKVKTFQLDDRYAELMIISNVRGRNLVQHELLARGRDHDEWREQLLKTELEKIRIDQLFHSSFSQNSFLQKMKNIFREFSPGNSAAVSGVPGIGKTTMVQKIVYDWATGKIYPYFKFVFNFKFRDLNTVNCRINLNNLILDQYPYFANVLRELWKNPQHLLFIFDGFDEFKCSIDFFDSWRNKKPQQICTDPECWCEVSDIVYSLIQHKLLPGCSVLVTTRPTVLHLLEKAEISVWAEILGFVGDERKEYFNKFFDDQAVAAAVFKHVEENEILYTMCYNPSYCWILGLSLGPFFTQPNRKQKQVPKTITQLYSYYIYNILKNHHREIEKPRDVLLKLGEMAFAGVSEKKIVFRNEDLIKYNLQPSQFLSGFLVELLERDDSVQNVVYTFPHLTIQEFLAALAQFLTPGPGDIRKLLYEAYSKEDGRFEIFIRFVTGLSSPQSARPLGEFLGPFLHHTTCQVIDWVKEMFGAHGGNVEIKMKRNSLLNIFHFLFESQNKALVCATIDSLQTLKFGDTDPQKALRLTRVDCAVLSPVLELCDTIKHLELQNCCIQFEQLHRLKAVLHKCQVLRLSNNNLGDEGVNMLSRALRNSYCQIQELDLECVHLTDACTEELALSLSTMKMLVILNLGCNNLKDSGMKRLSVALRNQDCKIQTLRLPAACLTDVCAEDLTSALCTKQSLMVLNLESNSFTDHSVPNLCEIVRKCRSLRRVGLWRNQFSSNGWKHLKSLQGFRSGLMVGVDKCDF